MNVVFKSYLASGGFSREGNPLIILPDTHLFFEVLESDLHLVLKYFIQIIPMAKQVRDESYIGLGILSGGNFILIEKLL